jgi:CPA2 family monovalent cation:H+ antiporter-2
MAGLPLGRVLKRIRLTREARYGALRGWFRGMTDDEEDAAASERMAAFLIRPDSPIVGKTIAELALSDLGVTPVSLRRRSVPGLEWHTDLCIEAGDSLLLRGSPEGLAAVELGLNGKA